MSFIPHDLAVWYFGAVHVRHGGPGFVDYSSEPYAAVVGCEGRSDDSVRGGSKVTGTMSTVESEGEEMETARLELMWPK